MLKLLLLSFLLSCQLWADDPEDWLSANCSGCSFHSMGYLVFPGGNMIARVRSAEGNQIELWRFTVPFRPGMVQGTEYNADAGNRERDAENFCSVFGNGFVVREVSYRSTYDTSQRGRPTPSYQTIEMLTCRRGGRNNHRRANPTLNFQIPVQEVRINGAASTIDIGVSDLERSSGRVLPASRERRASPSGSSQQ